ncbi:MAG: MBL fold metallo-hydrolase [Clostridia bacterium]|nr:MBL fold metallo-hydrolase [Clostridia bacterium]
MQLNRLTERVWIFPYEEARDRPNLGYIRGDRWSLAIDAGHSEDHITAFYRALTQAGLPLPALTILTHWHWDHTFAMHAGHGLTLACEKTGAYLRQARERISREGTGWFLALDESIRLEYPDNTPVIVKEADMLFQGSLLLDAGNCPVRVFQAPSPHTDDTTLVEVCNDRILFLGDACGGTFPTWVRDPALSRQLAEVIQSTNARTCVEGHWTPLSKEETVQDLLAPADP